MTKYLLAKANPSHNIFVWHIRMLIFSRVLFSIFPLFRSNEETNQTMFFVAFYNFYSLVDSIVQNII